MSDKLICGCGDGLTEGAECVNCVAIYKSKLHDLGLAYEHNTRSAMKFRDRISELEEEVDRLLTTMREILEECRNSGRGNEIVNERMFERIELAAWMALSEPQEIDAAGDG